MNDSINRIEEIREDLDFKSKLEKARITLAEDIREPPAVMQIDNMSVRPVTIFTKGNISVIKGQAKARKSFAVTMFAAAAVSNQALFRKFIGKSSGGVVLFDTEQSSYYVQQYIRRIYEISHGPGFEQRFYSFCLRPYSPAERVEIIEYVFKNFKGLDFVVIDGVRDLLKDINSPEESTDISSRLLRWSENSGAHILTVLHENKEGGKMRGHIGTELMNKAETIIKVSKSESDTRYSKINCEQSRGLEFDDFYFVVEDNVPQVISEVPSEINLEFQE